MLQHYDEKKQTIHCLEGLLCKNIYNIVYLTEGGFQFENFISKKIIHNNKITEFYVFQIYLHNSYMWHKAKQYTYHKFCKK